MGSVFVDWRVQVLFCHQLHILKETYMCLGSIYLIVLVACARVRTILFSMHGPTIGTLAGFIRGPTGKLVIPQPLDCSESFFPDSPLGRLIKEEIIPAIALLRQKYPLSMTIFFPTEFLQMFYQYQDVNCTNLVVSDTIFDSFITFKYVQALFSSKQGLI